MSQAKAVENPYTSIIAQQQQEKAQREAELKARDAELMSSEERRLQAIYDQRKADAVQAGQRQKETVQGALSFSGFGRSTFNADQQAQIQQSVDRATQALDAERSLAFEKYRMEVNGATQEELQGYNNRIAQLQSENASFLISSAQALNAMSANDNASYQEKIDNILKLSTANTPVTPLNEEEDFQAQSYAPLLLDDKLNIDTKLLEQLPNRLKAKAMEYASMLKMQEKSQAPKAEYDIKEVDGVLYAVNKANPRDNMKIGNKDPNYDYQKIGETLVAINKANPNDRQIVYSG